MQSNKDPNKAQQKINKFKKKKKRVEVGEEKGAGRADCGRILLNKSACSENPTWRSGEEPGLPMQGTPVQSLGLEDLLEKEMTTLSSILAWGIP